MKLVHLVPSNQVGRPIFGLYQRWNLRLLLVNLLNKYSKKRVSSIVNCRSNMCGYLVGIKPFITVNIPRSTLARKLYHVGAKFSPCGHNCVVHVTDSIVLCPIYCVHLLLLSTCICTAFTMGCICVYSLPSSVV